MKIKDQQVQVKVILAEDLKDTCLLIYPFVDALEEFVKQDNALNANSLFKLIGSHCDEVITFCSVMTNLDHGFVKSLQPSELLKLMQEVIKQNEDFFLTIINSVTSLISELNKASVLNYMQSFGLNI